MVVYFIIVGDILHSFSVELMDPSTPIVTDRWFYILLVALVLSLLIFKEEISELKIASILLFTSISLFIIVFSYQLIAFGTDQNPDLSYGDYYTPKFSREFFTAVAVFMTAYSFQFNLFPVLSSLKTKTDAEGNKAIIMSLSMAMAIYITLSFLAIYTFGSLLRPDIMKNVGDIIGHDLISIALRIAFAIVIVCHIPYVFFSCKESFLIIVDESDRRTVSKELERKLHSKRTLEEVMNYSEPLSPDHVNWKRLTKEIMGQQQMNKYYYYGGTILIYFLPMAIAMLVTDVGVVFQFGAALSGSSLQFIWPGYFYLHAERKFTNGQGLFTRIMAYIYLSLGVLLFFGLLGGTIYNIVVNGGQGGGH